MIRPVRGWVVKVVVVGTQRLHLVYAEQLQRCLGNHAGDAVDRSIGEPVAVVVDGQSLRSCAGQVSRTTALGEMLT